MIVAESFGPDSFDLTLQEIKAGSAYGWIEYVITPKVRALCWSLILQMGEKRWKRIGARFFDCLNCHSDFFSRCVGGEVSNVLVVVLSSQR